jgi:hypothetical protein
MMEEQKTTNREGTEKEGVHPVKKQKIVTSTIHNIIIGDFFSRESFFKIMPYLVYLTILAIIYIFNSYYAEKTFRQIEKTKGDLKELRFQYISSKSELKYLGKQTEIAKRVAPLGLKASTIPPFKIFYSRDSLKTIEQEEK